MENPIFRGTAHYYHCYRPRYPAALLSELVTATVGGHGGRMVDWGCGTGEVALPLSPYFDAILAVDIDESMVALAREKAAERQIDNVTWLVARAEDVALEHGRHDLIVAGSSFHWMDRELLAQRAYDALTDRGAIAILGGGSEVWELRCPWHEVAVRTLRRWLGERRRAGTGAYEVTKKHGDYLVPAGFTLESRQYVVDHEWIADDIVGYLYSTSFANPALFGDQQEQFEADLRAQLAALSPAGVFPERLDFYMILGRRHRTAGEHGGVG